MPKTKESGLVVTKQLFVRIGVLGCVHPLDSPPEADFPKSAKVLCQTARGLEIGEIVSVVEHPDQQPRGRVLRELTEKDENRLAILRVRRDSAMRSCRQEIKLARSDSLLIDAEPLFDGNVLYFYFADQVPVLGEPMRLRLSRAYHTRVEFRPIPHQHASQDAGKATVRPSVSSKACGTPEGCADCRAAEICGKRQRLYPDLCSSDVKPTLHPDGA